MKLLLVVSTIFLTLSTPPAEAKLRKWNEKMQQLGKTFSEILPLVSSSTPLKPAELKRLQTATEKLSGLAHTINMGPDTGPNPLPPEADPTIQYISGLFDRQVKYANRSLKAGQVEYARGALRKVAGYCIACHTRHDKGPDFPTFELEAKTKSLTPMERAELLAATRQFDSAFDEYEKLAANAEFAKSRPFDWEKSVRRGVNLAVRVKRDPVRAAGIIDKVIALPTSPEFFRAEARAWKESIEMWKAEPKKEAKTADELYEEAVNLSTNARIKQQYPLDHSGDILYLRASVAVHELLSLAPDGKHTSDALFLAGNAYRLLGEPLVSPLPEMYFEACVRHSPHTAIAGQCYQRFEESVYFGYSGSGGVFIPDDIQSLMNELKALALVKESNK